MQLSLPEILTFLAIVAVVMLIVLLYHLIFVSVSLRRVADRMEGLSKEVETVILKPIGAIEYLLDWFSMFVEGMMSKDDKPKKVHHNSK